MIRARRTTLAWFLLLMVAIGVAVAVARVGAVRHALLPRQPDAQSVLDRNVAEIWIEDGTLEDVAAALTRQTGVRVTVDRTALNAGWMQWSKPNELKLRNVTIAQVMKQLCTARYAAGWGVTARPTCMVTADGSIVLTSVIPLTEAHMLRSYDVRDLLDDAVAGAGGPMTGPEAKDARQRQVDDLIELLTGVSNIRAHAGIVVARQITELDGRLIVHDLPDAQREIGQTLELLRAAGCGGKGSGPLPRQTSGVVYAYPPLPPRETGLDARVRGTMRFEDLPLGEAIERLRDRSGVNIVVNWHELDNQTISRRRTVSLDVQDATLDEALQEMFATLVPDVLQKYVAYGATDGIVQISAASSLRNDEPHVRVYDIRGLAVGPGGVAPAGEERTRRMADLIVNLAGERIFDPGRSLSGFAWTFGGRLVMVQSWSNHRRIEELIARLRRGVQPPSAAAGTRHRDGGERSKP